MLTKHGPSHVLSMTESADTQAMPHHACPPALGLSTCSRTNLVMDAFLR
jgi:hypothetical protein